VKLRTALATLIAALLLVWTASEAAQAQDVDQIRSRGVIRHLGVPYAGFITGDGEGLDVELMKKFAEHLGVRYEFVSTDWDTAIPDLIGKTFKVANGVDVTMVADAPVRGDVLATGLTILPWREKILNYSTPTFPTQVWLVVRADSSMTPITPTGNIAKDIELTREKLRDRTVLCKSGTCLDPRLFDLARAGASGKEFVGSLNDLAPAVIMGDAEATLLDVPDAVMALQKFPGKIKIIGPLTNEQEMAVGFRKDQPALLEEFNAFFAQFKRSGQYLALVNKYYPLIHRYVPAFFAR